MHSGSIVDESAFTRELAGRDWVLPQSPGLIAGGGMFAGLCLYFDQLLESMAMRRGAVQHAYPAVISRNTLERVDYFDSFPGIATLAGEQHAITPAVCYHTYRTLERRSLATRPYRVTAVGACARWESGRMTASPERLWCFTMREEIFFGSPEDIQRECRALKTSLQRGFARAGVETAAQEATDPFFGGRSRGKLVLQKLKRLKVELRVALPEGRTMAIASINNHETFFTKRMEITFGDGTPARSGCAAIGLERCAYAFLLQNGLDAERWPAGVRKFLAGRKYREAR